MGRSRYRQGQHSHVKDEPGQGRSCGPQSWIGAANCYPDTYSDAWTYPFAGSDRGARPRCDSRPDRHSSGYCYTCPYRDTGFNCDTGSHGGRSADRHSGAYSYPSTNRDPGADGYSGPDSNTCAYTHSYGDTCTHGNAGSHGYSGAHSHSYPATYSYLVAYSHAYSNANADTRAYSHADAHTDVRAECGVRS